MRLSKRLSAILSVIPEGTDTLTDVGCDHGKLVVSAVLKGKCKSGIGVDISSDSLKKAIVLSGKEGVEDKITFLHCDGLTFLDNEKTDVCVIAGMGGNEITRIIDGDHDVVKTYILCPHQDAQVVREYMNARGLFAKKDFIVEDSGKFYPIIVTERGEERYSDEELFLGKNTPQTEEYELKNEKRLSYLSKIVENKPSDSLTKEIREEYEVLKRWQRSKI